MECILGIESSCDETAAAVVRADGAVLSSVVASQHDLHEEYGGVVPEIASRAHLERILPVIDRALADAGLGIEGVAAVAAGIRPGLIGSLLVGAAAAKAIAWGRGIPFHGIDHVAAHLFAGLLGAAARDAGPAALRPADAIFPALGIVVSGGHTSLFEVAGPLDCRLVGRTIDDAAGEAFDKAAVMLGLPHPGGPNLERCARSGDPAAMRFPLPALPNPLDFSFSGLKTKLLYEVRGVPQGRGARSTFARSSADLDDRRRADLAASFQRAVVAQVVDRVRRAAAQGSFRSVLAGGGVCANAHLRGELSRVATGGGLALVLPEHAYAVDNAAMIAGYAALRRGAGDAGDDLSVPAEPVSFLARGTEPKRVH